MGIILRILLADPNRWIAQPASEQGDAEETDYYNYEWVSVVPDCVYSDDT